MFSQVIVLILEGLHGIKLSSIVIKCEINPSKSKSYTHYVLFLTCDDICN